MSADEERGLVQPSPAMLLIVQGRTMTAVVEARLAAFGLNLRQFGVLGHLSRSPGLSFSELASRAGVTVQSMHATVLQLTNDGLIDGSSRSQGRSAALTLTDRGQDRLQAAERAVREVDEERFGAGAKSTWQELGQALVRAMPVLLRPPHKD